MRAHNATSHEHQLFDAHMFDAQIDALKSGVRKLIDRVSAESAVESSRVKVLAGKATEIIKAHPIATVAIAGGVGYLAVRIARR